MIEQIKDSDNEWLRFLKGKKKNKVAIKKVVKPKIILVSKKQQRGVGYGS